MGAGLRSCKTSLSPHVFVIAAGGSSVAFMLCVNVGFCKRAIVLSSSALSLSVPRLVFALRLSYLMGTS